MRLTRPEITLDGGVRRSSARSAVVTTSGAVCRSGPPSALTCLDAATEAWVRTNGEADVEQLYDQAVAAVRG